MADPFAVAQGAIRAAFSKPIAFTGAGLDAARLQAIKADLPGPDFQDRGNTIRRVTFEVQKVDLPQKPGSGNLIVEDPDGAALRWRVLDAEGDSNIEAWLLHVEATV